MVKRAVACTLAMLMMLQSTSTYAASVQMTKQTVRIQSASKQINRQSKENGEIEVEFVFSKVDGSKILENKQSKFQIILLKDQKEIQVENITSNHLENETVEVLFSNLEPGSYEIQVKGDKLETYTQAIQVEKLVKSRIHLEMTHFNNESFAKLENHAGTIGYGDFNQDGKVDEKDKEALIKAVDVALEQVT